MNDPPVIVHRSTQNGYEYGITITLEGLRDVHTSQLADKVYIDFPQSGKHLSLLHSHTNDTPPSDVDLAWLLDDRVDKIGVISYNGDAFMVYVGNGYIPNKEDFYKVLERIDDEVDADIRLLPGADNWSFNELNYMAIREQSFRIAREFKWTIEGGKFDG